MCLCLSSFHFTPICRFSSRCFLFQLFAHVRGQFRFSLCGFTAVTGMGSNPILDCLLPFMSSFLSFHFFYIYLVSVKTFSTLLLDCTAPYVLSAEFDKLLNVQKENQLCSSHWILVLNCGSSKPAKKPHRPVCTEHAIVACSANIWHYQCMINYILTAITQGMGLNGVTCEPSRIVHVCVIIRIACAYVLCCMLYLPVAFTVTLLNILWISIFFKWAVQLNMIVFVSHVKYCMHCVAFL